MIGLLYVNLNILFYFKNSTFSKSSEKGELFTFFQIVFNIWINRREIESYVFAVYHCEILHYLYIKAIQSHTYVVGKKRSILIGLSDNCGYSFLLLHQNLTIYVETETFSISFLYSLHYNPLIYLTL